MSWFPNPNQMSVSDRRTFPRQITALDGVQDVMLIVSRPAGVAGLCVEAALDTGHFPERPTFVIPDRPYVRRLITANLRVETDRPGIFAVKTRSLDSTKTVLNNGELADGWEFDWDRGPMVEVSRAPGDNASSSNNNGTPRMTGYDFGVSDTANEGEVEIEPNQIFIKGQAQCEISEQPNGLRPRLDQGPLPARLRRSAAS